MTDTHEIKGMSLREAINEYRAAQDDLKRIRKRIAEYRQTAYSISSPRYDGMPKAKGGHTSKAERAALRLAEMGEAATEIQADIMRYRRIIYEHTSAIPDAQIRCIIKARFIDGLSWESVAKCLKDGYDAESNKRAFNRFMKEYENGGNDEK